VDCSEVLQQLADYLDEEARAQLCAVIDDHLSRCTDCQIEVDTLRKTIVLYQNDRRIEMPAHLTQRLEAVMAREYQNGSAPAD
jgi:predicted anti-sigma-YlaC factor YlaD